MACSPAWHICSVRPPGQWPPPAHELWRCCGVSVLNFATVPWLLLVAGGWAGACVWVPRTGCCCCSIVTIVSYSHSIVSYSHSSAPTRAQHRPSSQAASRAVVAVTSSQPHRTHHTTRTQHIPQQPTTYYLVIVSSE